MKLPRTGFQGTEPCIDTLPDSLLENIFQHTASSQFKIVTGDIVAKTAARSIPLVSKRWHSLWNSSQALWSVLNLDLALLQRNIQSMSPESQDASLAALIRVLALRGKAVRRLWLHSDAPQCLPLSQMLSIMSPQLQQVFVGQVSTCDTLVLAQRFSQLRSLDLPAASYQHIDWASHSHLLTNFTGLQGRPGGLEDSTPWYCMRVQELALRDGGMSDDLMRVVGQLRGLKLLSLATPEPLPPAFHCQVGRLSQLEELHLYLTPASPHQQFELLPATLEALSRLRTLYILAQHSLSENLAIGQGLAELPVLQDLQIMCHAGSLPPDLWRCSSLTRLDLELKQQALGSGSVAPQAAGMSMPQLKELRLAKCRFPNSTLPDAFCQLGGLTHLTITRCGLRSESGLPGLPPRFSALTALASLSLEGNALGAVPPSLTALSTLRVLDLSANALSTLPAGPYLSNLEMISLAGNRLIKLPPPLRDASRCEVLDLTSNPQLELCRADVDAVLLRMLRLGLLLLGKWPGCTSAMDWSTNSVAALVHLAQRCPQLEVDFEHTAAEYENMPLA